MSSRNEKVRGVLNLVANKAAQMVDLQGKSISAEEQTRRMTLFVKGIDWNNKIEEDKPSRDLLNQEDNLSLEDYMAKVEASQTEKEIKEKENE